MLNQKTCIYCGRSDIKFCRSHVLPRGLGSFQYQPTLQERVCSECDTEIGKSEDRFIHNGIAPFFRNKVGIKGRSAFNRKHFGKRPIEAKAVDPITKYEILTEPSEDGRNYQSLPQMVLDDLNGHHARITLFGKGDITADVLKKEIHQTGLIGKLKVTCFGISKEQEDHIMFLLGITEVVTDNGEEGISMLPAKVTAELTCDKHYFQAIAKIGLHYYLMVEQTYHNGSESILGPVRRFIRYGAGDIESFVKQQRGHLTADTAKGLRPKFYSHFFVGHINNNEIIVNLQFFVGPDCYPAYYRVQLAINPFGIAIHPISFGHHYVYWDPEERHKHPGFHGVVQPLAAANYIIIPP
jgi:hypothetical protein